MLLAVDSGEGFWMTMAPALAAVLFSIASAITSWAAANSAKAAKLSGDKNSEHLARQDKQLATIEYQMTDECIVAKAKQAGEKIVNTAKAEAAKVLATAKQAAETVHAEARKVTVEAKAATEAVKSAVAEIKKTDGDSKVNLGNGT